MKRVLIVFLAAVGCDITYEPDVGALQEEVAVDAGMGSNAGAPKLARCVDSDPTTNVSFSQQIRPLTARSPGGCLSCHGTNTTSGFSVGSYESLRRGGVNSGTRLIIPGDP